VTADSGSTTLSALLHSLAEELNHRVNAAAERAPALAELQALTVTARMSVFSAQAGQ
jgi:hypothetical protein